MEENVSVITEASSILSVSSSEASTSRVGDIETDKYGFQIEGKEYTQPRYQVFIVAVWLY